MSEPSSPEKQPKKKQKTASSSSLGGRVKAFHARLIRSVSDLLGSTSDNNEPLSSHAISTVQINLDSFQDALRAFSAALVSSHGEAAVEDEQARVLGSKRWKDEVDELGTACWNTSTDLKYALEGDQMQDVGGIESEDVVAELRKLGFDLLELGTLLPVTPDARSNLITLATKVALAFDSRVASLPETVPKGDERCKGWTQERERYLSKAAELATVLQELIAASRNAPSGTGDSADISENDGKRYTQALVEFSLTRIAIQVPAGPTARSCDFNVARFVMTRLLSLPRPWMGFVEREKTARVALHVGKIALGQGEPKEAIRWLTWAEDILICKGSQDNQRGRELQVGIAKAFVSAYTACASQKPAGVGEEELAERSRKNIELAEATLDQLLESGDVVGNATDLWRQKLRLLITRQPTEAELIKVISEAITSSTYEPSTLQELLSKLLQEVQGLPDERPAKISKGRVFLALLEIVARRCEDSPDKTAGDGQALANGEVLSTLVSDVVAPLIASLGPKDIPLVHKMVQCLEEAQLVLSPAVAFFTCATLWRFGDSLFAAANGTSNARATSSTDDPARLFEKAADFFTVILKRSIVTNLSPGIKGKAQRKAVLALIEGGLVDKAAAIVSELDASASCKDHFAAFYTHLMRREEDRAIASVRSMASSSDLDVKMLFWASKAADEAGLSAVTFSVLDTIVKAVSADGATALPQEKDYIKLLRVLVRLSAKELKQADATDARARIPALLEHFRTATLYVQHCENGKLPGSGESVAKDIEWLSNSAYDVALRAGDSAAGAWSHEQQIQMYEAAAELAEQARQAQVASAGEGSLPPSKHALRAFKIRMAGIALLSQSIMSSNQITEAALVPLTTQLQNLQSELDSHVAEGHFESPAVAEQAQAALLLFEAEVASASENWQGLLSLIERIGKSEMASSAAVIKSIAERAATSEACPSSTAAEILKKTVNTLYGRSDLDVEALSRWLRTLIAFLISASAWTEALEYIRTALQVISAQSAAYPRVELDWIATTAWDQGVDLVGFGKGALGIEWCEAATQVAKFSSDRSLAQKLEGFLVKLKESAAAL